jgi:condensin complex subunit 2
MCRMLLGDETSRSKVNFQKASCTLDASIKIYSYRVDETAASTYRVLENLSRTDLDSAGGEGGGKVAHSKVGTKEASSKLGVADTLEKNLANINLSNVDRAFSVDPLFHKMSKTFDEAGSKGMLLNNLCVRDGCRVMFDSGGDEGEGAKGKGKHAPSSEQSPKVMGRLAADASSLCSKLQDLLGGRDLGSLSLVPQYDDFRAQLAELGDPQAAAAAADVARSEDYNPAEGVDDDDLAPLQPAEAYSDDDDDDCVDVGSGADMESFGGDHMETFGAPSSWGNADDGQRFSPAPAAAPVAPLLGRLCGDMRMVDDEYAFFDARALAAANQWAGAGHWKFAAPPKVATSADRSQHASGEDGAEEVCARAQLSVSNGKH